MAGAASLSATISLLLARHILRLQLPALSPSPAHGTGGDQEGQGPGEAPPPAVESCYLALFASQQLYALYDHAVELASMASGQQAGAGEL